MLRRAFHPLWRGYGERRPGKETARSIQHFLYSDWSRSSLVPWCLHIFLHQDPGILATGKAATPPAIPPRLRPRLNALTATISLIRRHRHSRLERSGRPGLRKSVSTIAGTSATSDGRFRRTGRWVPHAETDIPCGGPSSVQCHEQAKRGEDDNGRLKARQREVRPLALWR